jgi:predicted TIM-barrel fold metal-dependent hydrolase
MPRRKAVEGLPKEVRAWLDRELVEGNFSGYELLAQDLRARGYTIGKSAIHRYGQDFEERLKALRLVTEQARAVVDASPDDDDAVNQALVRLTQEKLFGVLMDLHVDPETVDIGKLTRSVADLARSSVQVKKYANEVKARAKSAAEEVAKVARKGGLSDEAIRAIEEQVLGIA